MSYGLINYCPRCDTDKKVFVSYREESDIFICKSCAENKVCVYCDTLHPVDIGKRKGFTCCAFCDAELNEPMPRNLY